MGAGSGKPSAPPQFLQALTPLARSPSYGSLHSQNAGGYNPYRPVRARPQAPASPSHGSIVIPDGSAPPHPKTAEDHILDQLKGVCGEKLAELALDHLRDTHFGVEDKDL